MRNDYRNTKYCKHLVNLKEKKKILKEKICKEHPRAKIIYNQVRNNTGDYKASFMEMYNYKCSYCGNSITNISTILFEVDHYICESSFDSREEAGRMENLVLACYDCNRPKSSLLIENEYIEKLNPDFEEIKNVFYRDDDYYIQIAEKFEKDIFINKFYEQLKLGYQTRRLDFLLMNMSGLYDKIKGEPQAETLNVLLKKLKEKRNLTSCK